MSSWRLIFIGIVQPGLLQLGSDHKSEPSHPWLESWGCPITTVFFCFRPKSTPTGQPSANGVQSESLDYDRLKQVLQWMVPKPGFLPLYSLMYKGPFTLETACESHRKAMWLLSDSHSFLFNAISATFILNGLKLQHTAPKVVHAPLFEKHGNRIAWYFCTIRSAAGKCTAFGLSLTLHWPLQQIVKASTMECSAGSHTGVRLSSTAF